MSESHAENASHAHPPYVQIYVILLVLLATSLVGPLLGIPALTLITAFGIAIVKATMVAAYFMHLNIEERYIWYVLFLMLGFMLVLFAGIAPDVLSTAGQNWWREPIAIPPAAH